MYTIFLFSRCFYVTVQPYGVSGGFYAAAPERQSHVTRCVSCSVRAPISRQSRKLASLGQCALWRQLAQTSLRKPRYRHRVCLPGAAAADSQLRGRGVNLAVREDGEHFCEAPEQKFYIRRPSKSEDCGRRPNKSENLVRDRIKEKWLNCYKKPECGS